MKIAVSAAEQIYNGSGRGPEKKAYVLEWLKQRGITVDEAKLDAMIESAVYELKSGVLAVGELFRPPGRRNMSIRIGQASLGETGAHGQKAGNQTGRGSISRAGITEAGSAFSGSRTAGKPSQPRRRAKLVSATRTSGTIRTGATRHTPLRKR